MHLHTSLSFDAIGFGQNGLGHDSAYRFAKGEPIESHTGELVQLRRPLDFLVIADHAVNMGLTNSLYMNDPALQMTKDGRDISEAYRKSSSETLKIISMNSTSQAPQNKIITDPIYKATIWERVSEASDRHYAPSEFLLILRLSGRH